LLNNVGADGFFNKSISYRLTTIKNVQVTDLKIKTKHTKIITEHN